MSDINIFEEATRRKLRFESVKGSLSVEQLWDLPLQSKTGFDLDTVAKTVNNELKSLTTDSFIPTARTNPRKAEVELALNVVVNIIHKRVDENAAAAMKAANDARKAKLMDALERKQEADLLGMTTEQIRAELAKL